MKERRRCQRIHHTRHLRARVHSGENARVLDLSPHGALVETEAPLRPGSVCDIALALDTNGLHLRTMIRRCRAFPADQGDGIVYRAGVEFLIPTPTLREPLEDLVAKLCLRTCDVAQPGGGAAA